jgi:hypothetical protein
LRSVFENTFNTTPSEIVARLESGFPSLQKKAWFQKPQEANKKTEGYHPSLKKNLQNVLV